MLFPVTAVARTVFCCEGRVGRVATERGALHKLCAVTTLRTMTTMLCDLYLRNARMGALHPCTLAIVALLGAEEKP